MEPIKIRIEEEDLESIKETLWKGFEISDVIYLAGDIYVTIYFINPKIEGSFQVTLQKQDDTGSEWVIVGAYAEDL